MFFLFNFSGSDFESIVPQFILDLQRYQRLFTAFFDMHYPELRITHLLFLDVVKDANACVRDYSYNLIVKYEIVNAMHLSNCLSTPYFAKNMEASAKARPRFLRGNAQLFIRRNSTLFRNVL